MLPHGAQNQWTLALATGALKPGPLAPQPRGEHPRQQLVQTTPRVIWLRGSRHRKRRPRRLWQCYPGFVSDDLPKYSSLRQLPRMDLARSLPLAHPLALHVEASNLCNFSCRMCPVSFDDYVEVVGGLTSLPFEAIEGLFTDLASHGTGRLKVLRLYGEGEPLLRKDIAHLVECANARGVAERIEITTNASALTEQVGRQLIASGLSYLRVSIYGVTEPEHRTITRSKVPLATIQKNIARFQELKRELGSEKPILYVKMIDRGNDHDNTTFRAQYSGIADEVAIEQAMNWDSYEGRDLLGTVSPVRQPNTQRQVCPYPFYSLVVKANGDVVCCCVDWSKHTKVGNILQSGFWDIWHGHALRDIRRLHLSRDKARNASCRNCTYFHNTPDNLDGIPASDFAAALG